MLTGLHQSWVTAAPCTDFQATPTSFLPIMQLGVLCNLLPQCPLAFRTVEEYFLVRVYQGKNAKASIFLCISEGYSLVFNLPRNYIILAIGFTH